MLSPKHFSSSTNRIDGVDLLRGLSIFFVLMNHVNMQLLGAKVPYLEGLPHQLASTLVWNGQFGVQIFFAVSGYLITSTSLRRWKNPQSLVIKDFYLLRFARIAPMMVLLLAILSVLHLAGVPHFVVSQKAGGLGRALLAALTFHINYLEATRGYLPGSWDILWSLSVEEVFYLFFPWVMRFLGRTQFLVPLLLLFVLTGPFARMKIFNPNPVWREYSYLGGMDAIAFGCLTAILLSNRQLSRRAIAFCASIGTTILVFVLGFSITAYIHAGGRFGLLETMLAVGACLVIAAAAQSKWSAPKFLSPVLFLGRRSYEVYLTHMFLVVSFAAVFIHRGKPMSGVPWLFVSAILFSAALGAVVSFAYSEPMNRYIRRKTDEQVLSAVMLST